MCLSDIFFLAGIVHFNSFKLILPSKFVFFLSMILKLILESSKLIILSAKQLKTDSDHVSPLALSAEKFNLIPFKNILDPFLCVNDFSS